MSAVREGQSVAAFFDIDGTLVPRPSLERRLFAELRYRRVLPARNYFLWLMRAVRLVPQGLEMIRHANKMYLRGVRVSEIEESSAEGRAARQAPPRTAMPALLFREGVERVAWHAAQGHAIVLVSGTLAPLARNVAVMVVLQLALGGLGGSIEICSTELEEIAGKWTGQIVGEALFGEAKGRAVRRFAREHGTDLRGCFAYGDGLSDRWMLEAVGRPVAVNPSQDLHRMARKRDWPILWWRDELRSTESLLRRQKAQETADSQRYEPLPKGAGRAASRENLG